MENRPVPLVAALLCAASIQIWAQQPRDVRASSAGAPVGAGAISGSVTNDDGSRPVRLASIALVGVNTGIMRLSSTDADGKFAFTNLPADRYTVGASKPPYLSMVAGAKRPTRPGTPIVLIDGQKIANISIRLPMGAAITGTVTDETGQPSANAQLSLRQWRMRNGGGTVVWSRVALTDDRGRYRFFGLAPGEYEVSAWRPGSPSSARALTIADVDAALRSGAPALSQAPAGVGDRRYAMVYFPGTTRASEALPIAVAAGEERQGVDFRVQTARLARVEGVINTMDGQPLVPDAIALTTVGSSPLSMTSGSRYQADGRFAFTGVSPGTYAVRVIGTGSRAGQFAVAVFEVDGADVLGVQLNLRPSLTLPGRLVFRGAAPPAGLAGQRILLRSLAPKISGAPAPTVSPTSSDGRFTVTNLVPGPYAIGGPPPADQGSDTRRWALESVVIDGRDVTDVPIEISADAPPKDLVVTFTDRFQELSGRITRAGGAPAPEHTIVVFPEDKVFWMSRSRRIVVARPDTNGRFTLSSAGSTTLPPGKYLMAAVTDLEQDEQFDPAFLTTLVPGAVPLTLQPGEKKVQDLVVRDGPVFHRSGPSGDRPQPNGE